MANIRAGGIGTPTVDVPVDSLVELMRDAGGGGFIESMLRFCWRCAGADFVSTFEHAGKGGPFAGRHRDYDGSRQHPQGGRGLHGSTTQVT